MITKINILNFRCFSKYSIDIDSKYVIITGNNATGKTSLLEAIYLASVTKSLRTNNIAELIQETKEESLVEVISNTRKYRIYLNEKVKKVSIDNKDIKRISDYIGNIPSVLFTPSELNLISSSPQSRRLFLNIELSQLFPNYVLLLSKYNSILKERNSYLKSNKVDNSYLSILTESLSVESLDLMSYRRIFIKEINSIINDIHKNFSNNEIIKLTYINSLPFDNTLNFLIDKQDKDIKFQTTNYGIHRDDVLFEINGRDAKVYASQGQKRSLVLSLKIALVKIIYKHKKKYPILLLDDVLSELDVERQNNLLNIILNLGQTFITDTNIDLNDINLLKNYQNIKL